MSHERHMKIQSLLHRVLVAPALCALVIAAPLSHATSSLVGNGFANGYEWMELTAPFGLVEDPVPAGGFTGTLDGNPLLFWCAELTQTFSFGDPQPYSVSIFTNTKLSQLFTEVGGSAAATSTTVSSAAFQLAIWEILFEGNTTNPYSLSTGNFSATGDAAALDMANTWLADLDQFQASTTLILLSNRSHQDFITDTMPPGLLVPEPGSLPLLGVGILAVMIAVRRRTQRAGR
jgi:PEP-CTERM motif